MEMPKVPAGNGRHPILLVALTAPDLAPSSAFYARVFGWQLNPVGPDRIAALTPAGPPVVLRGGLPAGSPGMVPFIGVPDTDAALERVVAVGGSVDLAPGLVPGVGSLAQFRDPSGTTWGLLTPASAVTMPHQPAPFGDGPRPAPGSVCSMEMYAKDGSSAARFVEELFGWGTLATMPQFMAFDPGAGIGGVFQSHTPANPAVGYVYVADVVATVAAVEAAGGTRQGDPMAMPGMATFGYFTDPSGTMMGLIGP